MLKYSRPSLESRCVWSSTGVLHTTFRAGSGVGPGAPGPTPLQAGQPARAGANIETLFMASTVSYATYVLLREPLVLSLVMLATSLEMEKPKPGAYLISVTVTAGLWEDVASMKLWVAMINRTHQQHACVSLLDSCN